MRPPCVAAKLSLRVWWQEGAGAQSVSPLIQHKRPRREHEARDEVEEGQAQPAATMVQQASTSTGGRLRRLASLS